MTKPASPQMPAATIETFARTVHEQASAYGFSSLDHVRLVTALLSIRDEAASGSDEPPASRPGVTEGVGVSTFARDQLPIDSGHLKIEALCTDTQCRQVEHWLRDSFGRFFLSASATSQPRVLSEMVQSEQNCFGLVSPKNGNAVGLVAYLDIDKLNRRAEFRLIIGDPKARGRGLGIETAEAWLEFGFEGLGLEKIFVQLLEGEIRSIRMFEKLGFKFEGILKGEIESGAERYNVARWGKLRNP